MNPTLDISSLLPGEEAVRRRREALVESLPPADPRRPGPRRRRRASPKLLVALACLLVASAGVAVAAGVFSADEIAVGDGVGCYAQPSLRASAAIFAAAADPVAKCSRVWREGVLTGGRSTDVPHLVACTGDGEPIRVFPAGGDGVCGRLGLVPLPADYAAVGRAHARAYAALSVLLSREARAPGGPCPDPKARVGFARRLLAAEYADVPVVVEGRKPCAGGYELSKNRAADRIAVRTVSRRRAAAIAEAREWQRGVARVQAALAPIFGRPPRFRRTRESCVAPQSLAAEARRTLDRAGFGGVRVRVAGDGACASLGARYNTCCTGGGEAGLLATVRSVGRRAWRATKAQDRRWKRLRNEAQASAGQPGGAR